MAPVRNLPTPSLPQQQEQHTHLRMLSRYRALLLDATYRPVGVANWQRAICLDLMEKAEVLEYYEDASVRSTQLEYFLPAVLRVRRHRPTHSKPLRVTLNRANILLRDQYSCQYCGSPRNLTIDHVKAQSKGGGNNWENLVACCTTCNSRKGDKSLEQLRWKLRQTPKEPSPHEMEFLLANALGSAVTPDSMPREWSNYILPFARKKKAAAVQAQPGHLHDAS